MLIVNKDPAAEEIVVEIPKGIINPSLFPLVGQEILS
jgi:hypothetical protein